MNSSFVSGSLAALKRLTGRGATGALNLAYTALSKTRQKQLAAMAEHYPRSFVLPAETIETQTAYRLGPTLQHVIKEASSITLSLPTVTELILSGMKSGVFCNYGKAIYINPHRLDELLETIAALPDLSGQSISKEKFSAEAEKHYLTLRHIYNYQALGSPQVKFRALPRGTYYERTYSVPTRDGIGLFLTRIINQDKVLTNDQNPSVLLIPGIACNGRFFDLDDTTSFALYLADQGNWVYIFEPRGLGKNKGEFDPQCFLDTLVSNDLPATVDVIYNTSGKKKVILLGHSMGGMIAQFMLIRQAAKLQASMAKLAAAITGRDAPQVGAPLTEKAAFLRELEELANRNQLPASAKADLAEGLTRLAILQTVKGLVTVGSPLIFDKNAHPLLPLLLMLNHLLPLLREEEVPVDKAKWLIRFFPELSRVLSWLDFIEPSNFSDPQAFLYQLVTTGTDSFPLGVGFQLLKAVYSGQGVKRMNRGENFNYSGSLPLIPADLPVFSLVAEKDPLCPSFNLSLIDPAYRPQSGPAAKIFPSYVHHQKQVRSVPNPLPQDWQVPATASQASGFLLTGLRHLDLFHGRTFAETVRPLLDRIIAAAWQA